MSTLTTLWRKQAKLRRLGAEITYRHGLPLGVAAAIEHEAGLRLLEVRTVIDVGANKGQFSLLAKNIFPSAIIHAFEPLRQAADTFTVLFQGDSTVHLHRCAAGERSGSAQIHVSGRADSSSLLPIGAAQDAIFPGTAEVGVEEIEVRRIDEILNAADLARPILLKLDVQGYELSALKGAERLLPIVDHVYAELSFVELYEGQPLAHEIIAWLSAHGFYLRGVYNLSQDDKGVAVQMDALFSISELRP